MVVKEELGFWDLQNRCWSGAIDTLKRIEKEGLEDEFMSWLEDYYCGCDFIPTMTELNDLLWFEDEFIFEALGIAEEDEDEEWLESLEG